MHSPARVRQQKRWLLAPPMPDALRRTFRGMHPVLAQVLYNRGLATPQEAFDYLAAQHVEVNALAVRDMGKAVGRLRQAIDREERIVVYGDYDADGVTSTALMLTVLRALGARVAPYIPHRVDEGYGLNTEALRNLAKERRANVVLTVDCGVRSYREVEEGRAAGLDIIITDHHSLGPELPKAHAVVNPKREDNSGVEPMLAGVGVAYLLASALLQVSKPKPSLTAESLLDLVAIGTVADLVPLHRPQNRSLVMRGLRALNNITRPGLRALIEVAGLAPGKLDAQSIAFGLAPRLNAAGRLGNAMTAVTLLTTQDDAHALALAGELHNLNHKRQDLTRAAQERVRAKLADATDTMPALIFAGDPEFQHGIVGLVAGKLVEEFWRPAVVLHTGEDESVASCRSIPTFDITAALDECADLLVRHGGHAQAAGFTVLNRNLPTLHARLDAIASRALAHADLRPVLEIDALVDPIQIDESLWRELADLEPCGHGNPAPVLALRGVRVEERRLVGKTGDHLKLKLARNGRSPLDAIAFGLGALHDTLPDRVDAAFALEINEFNGRRTPQLRLLDVRPAGEAW